MRLPVVAFFVVNPGDEETPDADTVVLPDELVPSMTQGTGEREREVI